MSWKERHDSTIENRLLPVEESPKHRSWTAYNFGQDNTVNRCLGRGRPDNAILNSHAVMATENGVRASSRSQPVYWRSRAKRLVSAGLLCVLFHEFGPCKTIAVTGCITKGNFSLCVVLDRLVSWVQLLQRSGRLVISDQCATRSSQLKGRWPPRRRRNR